MASFRRKLLRVSVESKKIENPRLKIYLRFNKAGKPQRKAFKLRARCPRLSFLDWSARETASKLLSAARARQTQRLSGRWRKRWVWSSWKRIGTGVWKRFEAPPLVQIPPQALTSMHVNQRTWCLLQVNSCTLANTAEILELYCIGGGGVTHRRAPASSAETGADRQRAPWPARWHFDTF